MDKRNKQIKRRFIVEIIDQVNIPFDSEDINTLSEVIQEHLQTKFDLEVDTIFVEKFSTYKNDWVSEDTLN